MEEEEMENETKKQKDLDLLNKMKKLPGGLVIIPLVIAVLLATFVPQVYQIGGYVTALFYDGNACMMGFFLIVCDYSLAKSGCCFLILYALGCYNSVLFSFLSCRLATKQVCSVASISHSLYPPFRCSMFCGFVFFD